MSTLYVLSSAPVKPAQAAQLRSMQVARPDIAAYRVRDAWMAAGYTSVRVLTTGHVEPSYRGCVPLADRRESHRVIANALRRGQHFDEIG